MAPHASASFVLDPRLKSDCIYIDDLALCRVLLMDDAQYPWLILVPRIANISEIHQLNTNEQQQLICESSALSKAMARRFGPDKMNIANLGNIVSQLHLHLVARFKNDPAWPGPVWGHAESIPYTQIQRENRQQLVQELVSEAKGSVLSGDQIPYHRY